MLVGLDGPRAILLWWTLPAYMALVGGAIVLSAGILAWETRKIWRFSQAMDSVLRALAFALIFARVEHVIFNWAYFSENLQEVFSVAAGGLDTHGAIVGAVFGGLMMSRRFNSGVEAWFAAAAFALPLIALAAWWGCAASGCAYGAEVANLADYPRALVWEASGDFLTVAPRFAVQPMGVWASAGVFLSVIVAGWMGMNGLRRAAFALCGVMFTSIALGFLRGDMAVYRGGLQMSAWLDIAFLVAAFLLVVRPRRTPVRLA